MRTLVPMLLMVVVFCAYAHADNQTLVLAPGERATIEAAPCPPAPALVSGWAWDRAAAEAMLADYGPVVWDSPLESRPECPGPGGVGRSWHAGTASGVLCSGWLILGRGSR